MARKIDITDGSEIGEDPKLVQKVDSMMDPSIEEKPLSPAETPNQEEEASADLPPLDIFAETQSAPPLVKPPKNKTKKAEVAKKTDDEAQPYEVVPETDLKQANSDPAEVEKDPDITTSSAEETKPPEDYDDPEITEAINDIVAQESDEVLRAEDKKLERKRAEAEPKEEKSGHPFFWGLVVVVCLIAIAIGVFIFDPNLHNPFTHFHWSNIRRHL